MIGTGNSITLNPASFNVGSYTLNLTFTKDGKTWQSNLPLNATDALLDLDTIAAYLSTASSSATADNPVTLNATIPLGSMTQAGSGWQNLLAVIAAADKYVALDLSGCTMNGTEFNPDNSISTGKDKIVSLDLPNGAASIAAGAASQSGSFQGGSFDYFSSLTAVTAKNVLAIGNIAFMICVPSLTSVSFPAVTMIGTQAFQDCTSLASLSFPAATSIGQAAFQDCTSLTSVSFPAAANIGHWVFRGCTSLISASFPASANVDEYNPFAGCINLTTITLTGTGSLSVIEGGKALVRNGTELVGYPSASGSINMNTITSIGDLAFYDCTSLTSVSFPVATSIGYETFSDCTGLTSVSFPAVSSIYIYAFLRCTGLTSVSFPAATSIASNAFASCTSLTSINIPAVASIDDNAFWNTGGTALTITLGVTPPRLGTRIFYHNVDVDSAKNVTVRFPADSAAAYGNAPTDTTAQNWGNAFRGMGWDGTAYLGGTINSNINLTYALTDG